LPFFPPFGLFYAQFAHFWAVFRNLCFESWGGGHWELSENFPDTPYPLGRISSNKL